MLCFTSEVTNTCAPFCLAVSAFYELIEWWVALIAGASSQAFLGTQGYEWETQADMAWALLGAVSALLVLGPIHDRQLATVDAEGEARRKSQTG